MNEYLSRGHITNSGGGFQLNVIHIDAAEDAPPPTRREQKKTLAKKIAGYARENTATLIFQVVAGICVLALAGWLGLNSDGGSSTPALQAGPKHHVSPYGDETDVALTVENTARSGVWSLNSPVMESFSGRGEPPLNAARWLKNGKAVPVRCARPGTTYEFKLGGKFTHWRFFAELEDGTYIAMAGFRETTEDGAQHLIPCEGT